MQKVEVKLKETVGDALHPVDGDIDRDMLEKFLLGMIDQLEIRANSSGEIGSFESSVHTLIGACAKLWEEKERWRTKFHDLADRYSKHLDKDIETYSAMLGHRRQYGRDEEGM